MEKTPLEKLKELLPNLEGKVHLADQDAVKEVIQKASDRNYPFMEKFMKMTAEYLENNAREDKLYRTYSESRNLIRTAADLIRQL